MGAGEIGVGRPMDVEDARLSSQFDWLVTTGGDWQRMPDEYECWHEQDNEDDIRKTSRKRGRRAEDEEDEEDEMSRRTD